MQQDFVECSVSVIDLENDPMAVLNKANNGTLAILENDKPTAYLVPAERYESLLASLESYEREQRHHEQDNELSQAIEQTSNEL